MRRAASVCIALMVTEVTGCGAPPAGVSAQPQAQYQTPRDQALTPGALCTEDDPDFDGYRYAERVPHCRRDVSTGLKRSVAASYGISDRERQNYQIDHLIPLALGGSNARANLWPVVRDEAQRKAEVEQRLYDQLASGQISQADAIAEILAWDPEGDGIRELPF